MRALLLILTGCTVDQLCIDLADQPEGHNHVQPFDVWIDPTTGEVWNTALETPTVAVIDPDTLAIDRFAVADLPLTRPRVVTDDQGTVWIASGVAPALTRLDRQTRTHTPYFPLDGVAAMLPRSGGGVIAIGPFGSGYALALIGPAGEPEARIDVGDARSLVAHPLGALTLGAQGEIYSLSDLSLLGTCPLPFLGAFGGVVSETSVFIVDDRTIGWSDCNETRTSWDVGIENKSVIPYGDGAIVLDRIGPDDPNNGIVRFVTRDGVTDGFVTGKNTGYGALGDGLLWANSEGTDEVQAWVPETGERVAAVRLGTFLDGLAAHPKNVDQVVATGRLSDTVKVVEDGLIVAQTHAVHWPYSPVYDLDRDAIWMVQQTEGYVLELDAASLDIRQSLDFGFASNPGLSFSTLSLHEDTLYFAESFADVVVAVDANSGAEAGRWSLGGPLITDPDAVGETIVRVHPNSGLVYVARTNDGRLSRIDPDTEDVLTAEYGDPEASHKLDSLHLHDEVLWFGPKAFDLDTLEATGAELDAADVYVERKGGYLVLDRTRQRLQQVTPGGTVEAELGLVRKTYEAMTTKLDPTERRYWFAQAYEAQVCGYAVADIQ